MTDFTGVPRAFDIRDAKRAREEESRKREQATSARNTSSTTIGSGGRLDVVGGDLTISDGGNASVKDGGAFRVEGGGSMEITDDGVVKVVGSTVDDITDAVMVAEAALSTEEIHHTSSGVTTRSPGLFFKTERFSGGKVSSFWGDDVSVISGKRLVDYGPLVEPGVYKSTSAQVDPGSAGLYASAAFGLNPDFTDSRSRCYMEVYPDALVFELRTVALGTVGSINVSMLDPKLRLYGRDGVDIKGPFTVDGAPVGGAVDSVAGKTGVVTLVKADVGLGNVDNTSDAAKPVSTATATALSGKASTAVATTTTDGLMSAADKAKLDAASPNPNANSLIYRDVWSRAQIADPVGPDDIANKRALDAGLANKASTSVATTTTDGLMSAADKAKLDAAGSATLISCYIATGSKANFATGNQAISTPGFSASRSNANLATPAAGKLTVTDAGVYTITFSLALFTTAAMTAIKPVTGRSFVDISDSASAPYSRTAIPVGEDVTTGNQGGLLLAAGAELKFNIIQTSGGTAYYRATIWIVKHP